MKPLRDPKPLVEEFTAWQKSTCLLLMEWCRQNWVAKGFKNQYCAYQFMHYWVNHEERLRARKAQKKIHQKPLKRMALLRKYKDVGKLIAV